MRRSVDRTSANRAVFRGSAVARMALDDREGINATDHLPFDAAGIPAFTVIKDFKNYDTRTRHTNADFADAVREDDLKQSATVMAAFAWQAASSAEEIPPRRNAAR